MTHRHDISHASSFLCGRTESAHIACIEVTIGHKRRSQHAVAGLDTASCKTPELQGNQRTNGAGALASELPYLARQVMVLHHPRPLPARKVPRLPARFMTIWSGKASVGSVVSTETCITLPIILASDHNTRVQHCSGSQGTVKVAFQAFVQDEEGIMVKTRKVADCAYSCRRPQGSALDAAAAACC